MKNKRFLCTLACAALLAAPGVALAESTDVSLIVGDEYVVMDEAVGQVYINDAGRTMIPLRLVNTALDLETEWSAGTVRVTGEDGAIDVTMTIGDTAYTANGIAGSFETAPVIKDGRTYLPARDFTELYGDIYWDGATRTVWIAQGVNLQYEAIGDKLLRADTSGIQEVALPDGYSVDGTTAYEPIVNVRTIEGVRYLSVDCNGMDFTNPLQLFRDDGDHLTYLTDVWPGTYYVDGSIVYYTDGVNAGAWANPVEPDRLYATDLATGQTTEHYVGFAVNACTLEKQDGQLVAVDRDGAVHTINFG